MNDEIRLHGGGRLRGEINVPGDKSISHRALIFNAMASGTATMAGLLDAEDVRATARCLRALGATIEGQTVVGTGGRFRSPSAVLDCGNSGTTMRLLAGVLSGQRFSATLTGDASLRTRPMDRIASPLEMMGADIETIGGCAPLQIMGPTRQNIQYRSRVASAQVKTALMLAALQTPGELYFEEPSRSRDHSERMLRNMGLRFQQDETADGVHRLRLTGPQAISATSFKVPGDISSAAFFLVAGSIVPDSDLCIRQVGINPTRAGVLRVLERMGADIEITECQDWSGEPVADLRVRAARLRATVVEGAEIASLVDELPVLAIAAAHADGVTTIRDAGELRVKESDRIDNTAYIITAMGGDVETFADGMTIKGRPGHSFGGFQAAANGDHRIAMSACVAALAAQGETSVRGVAAIGTSYPDFAKTLESIRG